jgi:hypothetical protein
MTAGNVGAGTPGNNENVIHLFDEGKFQEPWSSCTERYDVKVIDLCANNDVLADYGIDKKGTDQTANVVYYAYVNVSATTINYTSYECDLGLSPSPAYKLDKYQPNSLEETIERNQLGKDINIFPNPASEDAHIKSNEKIESIQIMDSHGRTVFSGKLNEDRRIDVSGLTSGLYILIVKNISGETQTLQILIE